MSRYYQLDTLLYWIRLYKWEGHNDWRDFMKRYIEAGLELARR